MQFDEPPGPPWLLVESRPFGGASRVVPGLSRPWLLVVTGGPLPPLHARSAPETVTQAKSFPGAMLPPP
jgi:hypothetical protein